MLSEVRLITPAEAQEMLKGNTGNYRKPCRKRVEALSIVMGRGEWELNGETIKIALDGSILDGQHRLLACVRSGVPIYSVVVTGIKATARNIDRGLPRTLPQWLSHINVPNAKNIAAICRFVVAHDKGLWDRESISAHEVLDSDVIEYESRHRDELQWALKLACRAKKVIPVGILGPVLHIGTRDTGDLQMAEWFTSSLATGEDLSDSDPVLHLRNRALTQTPHSKLSRQMLRGLVTLAWNKTVSGEGCSANGLRIRVSGPKSQKYPARVLSVSE